MSLVMPGFGCHASAGAPSARTSTHAAPSALPPILNSRDSITPSFVLRTSSTPGGTRCSCSHLSALSSLEEAPLAAESFIATCEPITCALPAATIGTAVVTMPKAPAAHPEAMAAGSIAIARSANLRAVKLLTGSRLARDRHRGGEGRARQRLVADFV